MFKRPAYISILVGFLSLYCALSILQSLRVVFTADIGPAQPVDSAVAAPAAPAPLVPDDAPLIPASAMPFINLAYAVISFVCTVNMLEGANWSRWLFTVSFLLFLICNITAYSDHFISHIPKLFAQGFVIPFLFLPGANEFFRKAD